MFSFVFVHGSVFFLNLLFCYRLQKRLGRLAKIWFSIDEERLDFVYVGWPQAKPNILFFLIELQMKGLSLRSGLESWAKPIAQIILLLNQRNELIQQVLIKMNVMLTVTLLLRIGYYSLLSDAPDLMRVPYFSLVLAFVLMISGWILVFTNPWFKFIQNGLNPVTWVQHMECYFDHQKFLRCPAWNLPKFEAEWRLLSTFYQEGRPCAKSVCELVLKMSGLQLSCVGQTLNKLKFWQPVFEMLIVFLPAIVLLLPLIAGKS